jgi:catechol 2,3-dioxygenase-like lactoylglutathione lyase family enzyme
MRRIFAIGAVLLLTAAGAGARSSAQSAQSPARPPITGVSHIAVYSADLAASDRFYAGDLGARKGVDPEDPQGVRYYFSPKQFVEVLPLPAGQGISRLAHVGWNTTDAAGLRAYLEAHGVAVLGPLRTGADGSRWFSARDPEGNAVEFVQTPGRDAGAEPGAISGRIIHVGFMIHDRTAEDRFYRGLLGFRPYWHGAMKPGATDWISQQVPDGRDWLEYMMAGDGSTLPLDRVDARQLGVLNHVSLGVPNMEAAVTTLIAGDRLSPRHDGPQMGRDGKWQANLYDPDGTRVELMEFQPVVKPCCSPFTAESPKD